MNIQKDTWLGIVGIVMFFVIMSVAAYLDVQDEEAQYQEYCAMVKLWEQDARAGVPVNDRRGWPPFKGHCEE